MVYPKPGAKEEEEEEVEVGERFPWTPHTNLAVYP